MDRASIWEREGGKRKRTFPSFSGEKRTQVLIIGGGMAGILCAWKLKEAGVDCILLEQGRIGGGTTKNTTAKVTAQHGLCYEKLIDTFGKERAFQYYEANAKAVEAYRQLAKEIPCGWEEKTAFLYRTDSLEALIKEAQAYEQLGIPWYWRKDPPLPMETEDALGMKGQGQIHPLKLLYGLSKELHIYENSFVKEIEGNKAILEKGTVSAEHIILATHFPLVNIPGLYMMKLYQRRSYVLAVEDGPQVDGMYLEAVQDGHSFRNTGDFLLLGGGGHKTGGKGEGFTGLECFASRVCPGKQIRYAWAAQDCMTLDGVPYIGRHRKGAPNLYVATGFQKWGMTGSMVSAMLLTDLITRGRSPWEAVFSPQRSMLHKQLFVNLGNSALHLVTPGKRCPHMGCALTWNKAEHSWDCPCHGSRFGEDGAVLNNPAKKPLKKV